MFGSVPLRLVRIEPSAGEIDDATIADKDGQPGADLDSFVKVAFKGLAHGLEAWLNPSGDGPGREG